jgi:hypothetical protein
MNQLNAAINETPTGTISMSSKNDKDLVIKKPNSYYRSLLIKLGVNENLLPLEGIDYSKLYQKIGLSITTPGNLKITEEWQITLLTDPMKLLNNPQDLKLTNTDNWGAGLAHYAAWSGSKDALIWVDKNCPQLIYAKARHNKLSVSHYAAASGSKDSLDFFLINLPHLLDEKTNSDTNIAHFALESGSKQGLDWILKNRPHLLHSRVKKELFNLVQVAMYSPNSLNWILKNCPHLLNASNNDGATIAHLLARTPEKESFEWLVANYPCLFQTKTNGGLTAAHIIAFSKFPEQFNRVQSLCEQPELFNLLNLDEEEIKILTVVLVEALETNYTLTKINNSFRITDGGMYDYINLKLTRNKNIKQAKMRFLAFLQGANQERSQISKLSCDLSKYLLRLFLPDGVDTKRVYEEICTKLSPVNRALDLINQEISRLKPYTEKNKSLLSFYMTSDPKIKAFKELSTMIRKNLSSTEILDWEHTNKAIINEDRNNIHGFFKSCLGETRTSSADRIDQIKNIFGIEIENSKKDVSVELKNIIA